MTERRRTGPRLRVVVATLLTVAALAGSCRVPPPARGTSTGEDLYRQNCVLCHGINGGGAQGPPLIDRPRTPAEIEAIVRSGRGEMPSFSDKLTDDQIAAVAAYVSDLARPG